MNLLEWCKNNNKEYLLKEWDYEKNASCNFYIDKISARSNKKVYWKCKHGHCWVSSPDEEINRQAGCPICNGRRLSQGINDLATTNPDLLVDWNYEKNTDVSPNNITRISRKRAYWKCHKCGNEWSIPIFSRAVDGNGCPRCALKIRGEAKHKTSLKTNGYLNDKELLKDWDEEANLPLTPKDYTPVSNKYAYWKCHICGYQWKAKVSNRAKGRGCPCCSNKIVVKGINDLATTHPDIAKEWHPTKNGLLTPTMVSYGYGKKVFWLCPKGHEYKATPNHRTGKDGTKCPICNIGRQSSFAEQALYYYIKKEYPDAINRYKPDFLERMELDIYIPSKKTAIEYDGAHWHKEEKLKNEQRKYKLCHENNIMLIRVREQVSKLGSDIADREFSCGLKTYEHKNLNEVITEVIEHLNSKFRFQIDVDVDRDEQEILQYSNELKDYNLETEYPLIANEWHHTKNGNLKPNMFKPYSDHSIWWLCPTCGNSYKSIISKRTGKDKTGCPKCGIVKSHKNRCIQVEMIDINTKEIIKTFKSMKEASQETNINHSNISMVCKGNTSRKQAGGYYWRYKK